jgi:hypothetical protein
MIIIFWEMIIIIVTAVETSNLTCKTLLTQILTVCCHIHFCFIELRIVVTKI